MSIDNYKEATNYEMFIRNVYECPRGMRNGADLCFMKNAMSMEDGETYAKHLGSFEKQFKEVKNYIAKALDKTLKIKSYSPSHNFFIEQREKLDYATTTGQLMTIVNDSLYQVIKHRDNKI